MSTDDKLFAQCNSPIMIVFQMNDLNWREIEVSKLWSSLILQLIAREGGVGFVNQS